MKAVEAALPSLTGFAAGAGEPTGCSRKWENLRAWLNLPAFPHTYNDTARLRCRWRRPQAWSDQDEVDQREKARRKAGGDQGVIDADVVRWLERGLGCFRVHPGGLERINRTGCEANHICPMFFPGRPERVFGERVGTGSGSGGGIQTRYRRWLSKCSNGAPGTAKRHGCRR